LKDQVDLVYSVVDSYLEGPSRPSLVQESFVIFLDQVELVYSGVDCYIVGPSRPSLVQEKIVIL
jgi:hypothetical protein